MNTKPLYITLAAVLVFGAWLFRYEVTSTGSGVVVYRLDRWTGNLAIADPESVRKLDYEKPPEEIPKSERWWESYPKADEQK